MKRQKTPKCEKCMSSTNVLYYKSQQNWKIIDSAYYCKYCNSVRSVEGSEMATKNNMYEQEKEQAKADFEKVTDGGRVLKTYNVPNVENE